MQEAGFARYPQLELSQPMSEEKSSSIGTMIVVAIAAGLIGYVIGKPASPQVQVKTPDTSEKSTEQEKSTEPGKSTEPKEPAKSEAPLPRDIPSLKALAEKGDARAQTSLALVYRDGKGVKQDDKAAVKWFHKSAEQGHPTGQVCLAQMYRDGKGVKQDYKKAIEWFTKAAEQGYPIADRGLGHLHLVGWGVPKDNEKDLAEIPDNVKKGLNIVPVSTVDEVLERALTSAPVPIEWVDVEAVASDAESSDTDTVVTH